MNLLGSIISTWKSDTNVEDLIFPNYGVRSLGFKADEDG